MSLVFSGKQKSPVTVCYIHELFGIPGASHPLKYGVDISLHLPGHGKNLISEFQPERFTWRNQRDKIGKALQSFGLQYILIGNSLGAALAINLAASQEWSSQIKGIVVYRIPRFGSMRTSWKKKYSKTAAYIEEKGVNKFLLRRRGKGSLKEPVPSVIENMGKETLICLFRAASLSDLEPDAIAQIRCPVYMISGGFDAQHPLEAWEQFSSSIRRELRFTMNIETFPESAYCEWLAKSQER